MTDINMLSLLLVFIFQLFGAWYHFHVMAKQGRVAGSFYSYIVADYPERSVATVAVLIGSAYLQCASGVADNINPELLWAILSHGILNVGTVGAIVSSVTAGYAFDSSINRGSKP